MDTCSFVFSKQTLIQSTVSTHKSMYMIGANADREILFSPVQLTTCRIGNLTRLILALAVCVTIYGDHIQQTGRQPGWLTILLVVS